MKRLLYLICVVVFAAGMSSCNKEDDPAPSPVVGKWSIDRARYSGFTGDFVSLNGDEDLSNPTVTGYRDDIDIKNDNTYSGTERANGSVFDYKGTWTLTSNNLVLKEDAGSEFKYTYDNSTTPNQLLGEIAARSGRFMNAKKDTVTVKYSVQLIYAKK